MEKKNTVDSEHDVMPDEVGENAAQQNPSLIHVFPEQELGQDQQENNSDCDEQDQGNLEENDLEGEPVTLTSVSIPSKNPNISKMVKFKKIFPSGGPGSKAGGGDEDAQCDDLDSPTPGI